MSLTQKQIYDLNNMNVASQNVSLGTTLNSLIEGSGGGVGDVVKIVYDETTMSIEDLGVAVKAVVDAGKIPVIVWNGAIYYNQVVIAEEGGFSASFSAWGFGIIDGDVDSLGISALALEYTEGDGWTLQEAYKAIVGR